MDITYALTHMNKRKTMLIRLRRAVYRRPVIWGLLCRMPLGKKIFKV